MAKKDSSQAKMNQAGIKTYLIASLKGAAACLLIWYLFKSGRLRADNLLRLLRSDSLPFLGLSAFAFMGSQILSSIRMMFLLKAIGLRTKFVPLFKLTMIGNFFNMVIPGTVGGDLIKGFYLTRFEETSRGRSSGIVAIDRVVGLIALSLFGFVSAIYVATQYGSLFFPYHYELWGIITVSFIILATFFATILICKPKSIRQKIRNVVVKIFPSGFFLNLIEGLALITKEGRYISYSFLISIAIQGISLAGLLNLVHLTGENRPDMFALVAVSSIVMLLGVIPLTPGNIGWTEILATFGWAAVGAKGGAEVFLSWRIITVLCSLMGGLFYLFPSRLTDNHHKEVKGAV